MKKPGASRAPGRGKKDKEGIMVLTNDCYITSPESQNDLADNSECLLAGVARLQLPVFVYGRYKPKPPAMSPEALVVGTAPCRALKIIIVQNKAKVKDGVRAPRTCAKAL